MEYEDQKIGYRGTKIDSEEQRSRWEPGRVKSVIIDHRNGEDFAKGKHTVLELTKS